MNYPTVPHRDIEPTPLFPFDEFESPKFSDVIYDITDFGAIEGGKELNTKAIADAIADASENGGGTVLVPKGVWLTGAIHFKSNINLHIEKGATLLFSQNYNDYLPVVKTRWEGLECYNYSPLIYGIDCDNVAVTGEGVLDGQGSAWHHWKKTQLPTAKKLYDMTQENVPVEERIFGVERGIRPSFIQFFNSTNVLIQGLTIKSGPMWTIHPVYCSNIRVDGCKIITRGSNTDGCNLDSCKNGIVENCYFDTGDDCICLKSGVNEDGWRVGRPCENIIIRYCYTKRGHGGVVTGSEISGGVRNIFAYDCVFKKTSIGIRFKSMRGRGAELDGFYFENIQMEDILHEAVIMTMFYNASTLVPKTQIPTVLKNVLIRDLQCKGCECGVSITGLPEQKIENILLENIEIEGEQDYIIVDAENVKISNFKFKKVDKS